MSKTSLSQLIPKRSIRECAALDLSREWRRLEGEGHRLLTFYAGHSRSTAEVSLTLVLIGASGSLSALRTHVPQKGWFPSFLPEYPSFHVFEREIFEQTGITPEGNPWLKPVRCPEGAAVGPEQYPFFSVEGKEVHEVGVGPVHAGVIEPGHFRFMCYGETIHHLEIQLGYQHRGIEALIHQRDPRKLAVLVESVAGDSSVAHVTAYSLAIEALGGQHVGQPLANVRDVAIELERMAMHLAGLSGLANDIAYLPGASTYGRLRTAVINTSMKLCGSRFGRCWIRPGGVRFGISHEQAKDMIATLTKLRQDVQMINDCMFTAKTVRHRFKGTGRVTRDLAIELGLVGMIARSSGVPIDLRQPTSAMKGTLTRIESSEKWDGDCLARALIRRDEINESIDWMIGVLGAGENFMNEVVPVGKFAADSLVVAGVEGWRGEVIHCMETDNSGTIINYRIQDPSLRNWFGLAQAVRSNAISDFPICNKSFDLSYCGNDL